MLVKRGERAVGGACPISAALSVLVLSSKRVYIGVHQLAHADRFERGESLICLGISLLA